ncbi:hypothetical protein CORC01_12224 [Colletotrichum orchidophilum]|uniref:Uncharacterized protein n=1 Tax=Colletotrichum orchidophilum TaxID=1209926 RepID=A0A1G4ATT4_9PEZI|nr:uncharacterized protein CORC01_12224 [Colletotrichum orchidophilum]OHE92506.1 hypothetical protein CORC01_12224 [Colletotrichum orchidophilum]
MPPAQVFPTWRCKQEERCADAPLAQLSMRQVWRVMWIEGAKLSIINGQAKRDIYALFVVAGCETTATVTYLLLRNSDNLARLVNEIREVEIREVEIREVRSEDDLDTQRLSALPNKTAVLNEARRWLPVVPVINPTSISPLHTEQTPTNPPHDHLILESLLRNLEPSDIPMAIQDTSTKSPLTIKVGDRTGWLEALKAQRPVLVHLNADTTWLIQLPYPPSTSPPPGRKRFNILIDPWLQGPQSDVASWFSTQWHVVEPSVKTMDQLNSILAGFEDGSDQPKTTDKSYIDVVTISHEFTDHCHQATLEELPKSTPVFATDKAAELIRSWSHFSSVTTTPGFSSATKDWKSELSISNLPPWVGIGRVITAGNALYYHSAIIIAFDLGNPETILYSPHGIKASDLECIRNSGFSTLALLHGLHDVRIWMTKQLNLGALNGIQAVAETEARYWVATHDEAKKGGGLIAPLLLRTQYTLKQAVEAEEARMKGRVPEYDFVELGSGDGLVLQ